MNTNAIHFGKSTLPKVNKQILAGHSSLELPKELFVFVCMYAWVCEVVVCEHFAALIAL